MILPEVNELLKNKTASTGCLFENGRAISNTVTEATTSMPTSTSKNDEIAENKKMFENENPEKELVV